MIREVIKNQNQLKIISDRGEKVVKFHSDVWEFIKFETTVVVLLKHCKEYMDKNIKKIDEEGKCVWTVEQPDANVPPKPSAFTYLGLDNKGKLVGGSWNDYTYVIDFATGKFIHKELKR
jgi:hypothetical protein